MQFLRIFLCFILYVGSSTLLLGQYCVPQFDNICEQNFPAIPTADFVNSFITTGGITNITHNNTGCNFQPNNYGYYPNKLLTAVQGCSFNISVQGGATYIQGFCIWIDFNQDGDYVDAGELVYNSGAAGAQVFTGTCNVPANALLGNTRMRVRSNYQAPPTSPCNAQIFGEVEEFPVTIVANTDNAPVIDDVTICAGTSAVLTATSPGVIRWYNQPTGGALIMIGPTYTTPVLNATTTYYVQSTVNNCVSPRVPVVVTVVPPFNVSLTASATEVCSGSTVTLTAPNPALTYTWTPSDASNATSTNIFNPIINATTTFNVSAVDANGCSGSGSVTITALPAPTLNLTSTSNSFCIGGSSTLTASGGTSYTWTPLDGLSSGTGATVTATPLTTTTYTASSASAGGCPATASVTITVNQLPDVSAGEAQTECAGAQITLNASGANTYAWSPATGLSSSTAANPTFTLTATSTFTVTGTDANGCVASDEVTVTLVPLPVANAGTEGAICVGNSLSLSGSGAVNYQWSPATGLNNATIANPVASPVTTTNYTLVVSTAQGCTSLPSAPITVVVNPLPAAPLINASGPLAFCQGGNVTLTAPAASSYVWSNGATTSSISVSASGSFTVQITDANGCVSPVSNAINVNVSPPPPTPVITVNGSSTVCAGQTVSLSSSAAQSYLWSGGGVTSQNITVNTSGTYTVTITDINGCTATSLPTIATILAPLAPPLISASSPLNFCEGGSVTLTAPLAAIYNWSNGAISQSITVSESGIFSVIITDANGCVSPTSINTVVTEHPIPAAPVINASGPLSFCFGESVTLSLPANQAYTWSSGQTTQAITVAQAGTFSASITNNNGCVSPVSESVTVTVLPQPQAPVISASGPTNFCQGNNITLTSNPATGIVWNTGATSAEITVSVSGTFNARFTDNNGCTSPLSNSVVTVVQQPAAPPQISVSNGTYQICTGDTVELTASNALSYSWSTGATSQSIPVTESGTYTVTTTYVCAPNNTSVSATIIVRALPEPTIQVSDTIMCLPAQVQFTGGSSVGVQPFTYAWSFGDNRTSSSVSPMHEYLRAGNFDVTLTITDPIGCSGTLSIKDYITVHPPAMLNYTINPRVTTLTDGNVSLINFAQSTQEHVWEVEGIGSSLLDTFRIRFSEPGIYPVTFSAVTAEGCRAEIKDEILVVEDFAVYIPNAVTPNEDGLNDVFTPVCTGHDPSKYEFSVYDRWGTQLFNTRIPDLGWTPGLKAEGSYIWVVRVKPLLDDEKVYSGNVVLLR